MAELVAQPVDTNKLTSAILFDWRRLLLLVCVACLEVLWLGTLMRVILDYAANPFPVLLFQWYIPIGFSISIGVILRRILLVRKTQRREQLIVLWMAFALSMLFALSVLPFLEGNGVSFEYGAAFDVSQPILPDGIILLPIIGMAVVRGAAIGRISLTPERVNIQLRFGVMMFFIATLLSIFVPTAYKDQFGREMLNVIPLFFAFSLFAIALARSASLKIHSSQSKQLFGLSWMGFLTLTTLVLISISLVTANVIMHIDREDVFAVLKVPFTIAFGLVFLLAAPFLYLAEMLFSAINPGIVPQEVIIDTGEKPPPRTSNDKPQIVIGDFIHDVFNFLTHGFGIVCLGIFIFVILFWIFIFLVQDDDNFLRQDNNDEDDAREKAGRLRSAFNRFGKIANVLGLTDRFRFLRQLFGELSIRWLYSRMERIATKRGFPRIDSQTPNEYREQLGKAFPDGEVDIQVITNAYVAIRYGELPENGQSLNQVQAAFERLKKIIAY